MSENKPMTEKWYKTIVMGTIVKYFNSYKEASKDIGCLGNAKIIEVSKEDVPEDILHKMTLKESLDDVALRNMVGEISQEEADQLCLELRAKHVLCPHLDKHGLIYDDNVQYYGK